VHCDIGPDPFLTSPHIGRDGNGIGTRNDKGWTGIELQGYKVNRGAGLRLPCADRVADSPEPGIARTTPRISKAQICIMDADDPVRPGGKDRLGQAITIPT